jgi:hypothetical protein
MGSKYLDPEDAQQHRQANAIGGDDDKIGPEHSIDDPQAQSSPEQDQHLSR